MPLLDHVRPPLRGQRHWESFHSAWATAIMGRLNQQILPSRYVAEAQVHVGSRIEIDVATREHDVADHEARNGGVAVKAWAPPAASMTMPAVFPDEIEIQVIDFSAGPELVGAIELVSPGNKDRPETRRAFACKCASLLHQGVGLLVVDIVTNRLANLHDDLIELLHQEATFRFPESTGVYAVSYRPRREEQAGDRVEMWTNALAVGAPLPTMPLALRAGPTIPIELEATYSEARANSRL